MQNTQRLETSGGKDKICSTYNCWNLMPCQPKNMYQLENKFHEDGEGGGGGGRNL